MTRKPCRNSHFIGPPRRIPTTLSDGSESYIVEREYQFDPDYGRKSLTARIIDGFNPDDQDNQIERCWSIPGPEFRRRLTDPHSPECPLSRFIGNENAKDRLSRAAYVAWGRENHCCSDMSFALLGPSSVGKTTLARLFGETMRLPFIDIHPKGVRDTRDLFELIGLKLEETIVDLDNGRFSLKMISDPKYPDMLVPPCVVLIDEVHALPRNIVPELLKATEPKDGMMVIENGCLADCRNVCWVIATTERGLLFPPFENRFRKIQLEMYTRDEIAQIVKLTYPTWNMSLYQLAAKYSSRVPREALAFAADMKMEWEKNGGDWEAIAARIARDHGIDRWGLTKNRVKLLAALGQLGPMSRASLCDYAQCGEAELVKYEMPALLACSEKEPALVVVTSNGYAITNAGLKELEIRGIPHRGYEQDALDFGTYDQHHTEAAAETSRPRRMLPRNEGSNT
jgi:Holliday junction resolvasome RuvABC ATP-dependent DNA helicase subunit